MPLAGQSASGNIYPSRFVKKSGAFTVAQAGAGEAAIGISQEGSKDAPLPGNSTLAAVSGDPLRVYADGDVCLLEAGATVAAGAYIKSDTNGKATTAASTNPYFAICERGGDENEKLVVLVKYGITP